MSNPPNGTHSFFQIDVPATRSSAAAAERPDQRCDPGKAGALVRYETTRRKCRRFVQNRSELTSTRQVAVSPSHVASSKPASVTSREVRLPELAMYVRSCSHTDLVSLLQAAVGIALNALKASSTAVPAKLFREVLEHALPSALRTSDNMTILVSLCQACMTYVTRRSVVNETQST
jgi:hypothetical protein